MKLKLLYTTTAILIANFVTAQVLYSENFDNLTVGDLSTDLSGNTPGQGGWYVSIQYPGGQAKIISEPNRGNVLATGLSTYSASNVQLTQRGLDVLWNNRTPGNDILLVEYDLYIARNLDAGLHSSLKLIGNNFDLFRSLSAVRYFPSQNTDINTLEAMYVDPPLEPMFPLGLGGSNVYEDFQYDTWISIQICMDYTTGYIYLYIPSFQILSYGSFSHNESLAALRLLTGMTPNNPQAANKFDNIRISALKTLPSYLGVDDFISSKFNIFPNPVTDIVTISNAENIAIEEIVVYDINGRIIKSKDGKKANEIQLNIEDLASGTYMLHIKTNEGVAAKKIVKK